MALDPVLNAINVQIQNIGYKTKLSTAQQFRSYDEGSQPIVLVSSLKRPTVGWISTKQGAATRLYRIVLVQKNDLSVSAPLSPTAIEYQFKNDILASFQGINYTTFASTPAWNSTVIDDDNFETSKLPIAYSFSAMLIVVDCLEVTTAG